MSPDLSGPTIAAERAELGTARASRLAVLALAVLTFCAAAATAQPTVELVQIEGDLDVVDIGHTGDGSGRLILGTTDAKLLAMDDGVVGPEPLLDLGDRAVCCGEQGFTAFAFHPDFPTVPSVFVLYSALGAKIGNWQDSVLARVDLAGDGSGVFDPETEEILLRIPQPAPNHNADDLEFGPDGFLYVSTGDGGSQGDLFANGQDGQALNGKILRLDVDGAQPYAIPADNPFVGDANVLDEIFALGLRNPWRIGFDPNTGDLWIADAGQDRWEEVDLVPAVGGVLGGAVAAWGGQNFGWSEAEGDECYVLGCALETFDAPVVAYCHPEVEDCPFQDDCSIVGARRYRGHTAPELAGWVVFADYCSGRIRGFDPDAAGWQVEVLYDGDENFLTLGEGEDGELYVATFDAIYRLRGLPAGFSDDFESGDLGAWSTVLPRAPRPRAWFRRRPAPRGPPAPARRRNGRHLGG